MDHERSVWAKRHRQYERYVIASWDLRIADDLVYAAIERGLFDDGGKTTTEDVWAYSVAIAVTYSRAFTAAKGHVGIDAVLKVLNSEQRAVHQRVWDLRNEIYAHTDKKHFFATPEITDGKVEAWAALPREYLWGFTHGDLKGLSEVIGVLRIEIGRRKQEFESQLIS